MTWLASGLLAWVLTAPGAVEAEPAEPVSTEDVMAEPADAVEPSVPEGEAVEVPEPDRPAVVDGENAGAEPVEPAPTDVVAPPALAPSLPTVTPPAPDHVRIHPPKYRGTGLFVGAGVAFGVVALYQVGDVLLCGGCAIGILERLGLAVGIASAAGGGVVRAYHDAWYDTALRRTRAPAKRFIVAGAVLTGVGGALGLTNEMLWWGCWVGGVGPYAFTVTDEWGPWTDCRHGVAQGLTDGASALVASGGGLLGYGLALRKRQGLFRRAKVVATVPSFGLGRSGLSLRLGGRF